MFFEIKKEEQKDSKTRTNQTSNDAVTFYEKRKINEKSDVKLSSFIQLLDRLASSQKTQQKILLIEKFIEQFYSVHDHRQIFQLMRLLMSNLDRERGNYGLKESSLAKFYADILLLPPAEADRLKHWKNPTKQPIGSPAGDFVGVLVHVMKNRARNDSKLSLNQLNQLLDQLARSFDNDKKRQVLARIVQDTTVDEQKWIARIILKDLKIGIGHETILKNYHPDALELFNATSDLRSVFEELQQQEDQHRLGSDNMSSNQMQQLFRMFFPIKPMLAGKLPPQQIAEMVRKENKVIVENKYDGERIQCHMQDGVVKFFTRNSNNYTRIYGPAMSKYIKENVDAQAVILDGEMVVWDNLKNQVAPFGQNKQVALREYGVYENAPPEKPFKMIKKEQNDNDQLNFDDSKSAKSTAAQSDLNNHHLQLCYKVFDILYIKAHGDSEEINLMGARLQDRKVVLSRIIKEIPNTLEVVMGKECDTVDQVFDEFNQSIYKNEEGIIIKKIDSVYKPNERSINWIKLKGEYIDSLGDTLDLIIIGGYFGERKRIGGSDWTDHINVFLVGVMKKLDKQNPDNCVVYPFSRVGTGYSMDELQKLRQRLKPYWKMYDARMPPPLYGRWVPSMSDRPDVYITDVSKSVILEIRAGELVVSDQYPTMYTLRFPRVLKIRYDKNWDEAFSHYDLQDMIKNFQESRRLKKKDNAKGIYDNQDQHGDDGESSLFGDAKKKRRNKKKIDEELKNQSADSMSVSSDGQLYITHKDRFSKVVEFYREADIKNVVRKSDMFKGMEFYIVNVDDKVANKPYLESRIVEHGGARVQNLRPSTTHIIAANIDFKVKILIEKLNMNIVKYSWILACIERGFLVDLEPIYMLHANSQLLEYFRDNLDPFNDHYTQMVDVKRLKDIINQIPDEKIEFQIIDCDLDIENIYEKTGCRGLFYKKKFYLIRCEGLIDQMQQFDIDLEYQTNLNSKFVPINNQNDNQDLIVKCIDKLITQDEYFIITKLRLYGAIVFDKLSQNQQLQNDQVDYIVIIPKRVGDQDDIKRVKQIGIRRGIEVVDIDWIKEQMSNYEDKIIHQNEQDNIDGDFGLDIQFEQNLDDNNHHKISQEQSSEAFGKQQNQSNDSVIQALDRFTNEDIPMSLS